MIDSRETNEPAKTMKKVHKTTNTEVPAGVQPEGGGWEDCGRGFQATAKVMASLAGLSGGNADVHFTCVWLAHGLPRSHPALNIVTTQ